MGRRLACLKSVVKYARMLDLCPWTIEVKLPARELTRDTRGPGLDTIRDMLTLAGRQEPPAGPRNVALVRLAYDLGLRISELARLDMTDVDLKTGALWVFGKGRRAKELLTMPATSREAVAAWLTTRGKEKCPLFLSLSMNNRRGRLCTRGVYRIIRDLGAAAGVQVRPHGIRPVAGAARGAARGGEALRDPVLTETVRFRRK